MDVIDNSEDLSVNAVRAMTDTFIVEENRLTFDDYSASQSGSRVELREFTAIAGASTPELRKLATEARHDERVIERRELAIEKGTRVTSIYNEAVRFGAQYGYAHSIAEFNRKIAQAEDSLNQVFNFNHLLLMEGRVLPPVVSLQEGFVYFDETTYTEVDESYQVTAQARFVRGAPTYHQYLHREVSEPKLPSKFNIPLTDAELTHWANGIFEGWHRGRAMAQEENKAGSLSAMRDLLGMVRFHLLLKHNMVTPPTYSKNSESARADRTTMDVGIQSVTLINEVQFNDNYLDWKALPMLDEIERELLRK